MELTHMLRDPPDPTPGMGEEAIKPQPYYPHGLSLTLGMEELESLGIEGLPTAGTEFHLEALGVITCCSTMDPDADGDVDHVCLTLQIKHMGFEHEESPPIRDTDEDRAKRMYGG